MLRQIECLRGADQIFLRSVRRKHRTHLVLLAIEPGDEEHLHRAAAIPVALLVVRAHAADARAESLRDHGRERRIPVRRDAQLPFGGGGAADGADLAVRPGLRRHPCDGIGAVGQRRAQNVVVAFGEEVAALVHLDIRVAALDGFELGGQVARRAATHVPVIEVVRRADKDDRILLGRVLGPVDVGRHAFAVAHRHHDFALDDGERFQLLFGGIACGNHLRVERRTRLGRGAGANS